MSSYGKGAEGEREFCDMLRSHGWTAERMTSSGSSTARDKPDVLAVDATGDRHLACEVKTQSSERIYIDGREIEALSAYCAASPFQPVVVYRWKSRSLQDKTFYAFVPQSVPVTEGGRLSISHDMAVTPNQNDLDCVELPGGGRPAGDTDNGGDNDE